MKLKYKHIDASREVRLWLGQIVIPIATLVGTGVIAIPEFRRAIVRKAKLIKLSSAKRKFRKKIEKETKENILTINAKNKDEALSALEVIARDIMTGDEKGPIKKVVRMRKN